jgi:hypothetical protein
MTSSVRSRAPGWWKLVAVATLVSGLLPVVSSCGSDAPATKETAPPGEEITVTSDSIEFGDRLIGAWVPRVATEDGDVYVLAGGDDEPPDTGEASSTVLAAFDDAGVERWRTELEGAPSDVAIADGDPWVSHGEGIVTRLDSSDGRILDHVTLEHTGSSVPMMGAFGSVWATPGDSQGRSSRLVRIDPDLSTSTIELGGDGYPGDGPVAGAGAIWFPLGARGVAMIDPDTNEVTVIPVDDLGSEARIAVDGDVVYVAPGSGYQVTSIVDGEVHATVPTGEVTYLGPIEGVFGVLDRAGQFRVLGADDPMVLEFRDVSTEGQRGPASEIDGEAWAATGDDDNFHGNLHRLELLPVPAED